MLLAAHRPPTLCPTTDKFKFSYSKKQLFGLNNNHMTSSTTNPLPTHWQTQMQLACINEVDKIPNPKCEINMLKYTLSTLLGAFWLLIDHQPYAHPLTHSNAVCIPIPSSFCHNLLIVWCLPPPFMRHLLHSFWDICRPNFWTLAVLQTTASQWKSESLLLKS